MLHLKIQSLLLLIVAFAYVLSTSEVSDSSLRRITVTPEQALNLHPTQSDSGNVVAFESTADLGHTGGPASFHTIRAQLTDGSLAFGEIGRTRAIAPMLTSDGRSIVFASFEDLVGKNADRNSEIFHHDGSTLRQLTRTATSDEQTRLDSGSFEPAISGDGELVVFSSSHGPDGLDLNGRHIFLYEQANMHFSRVSPDCESCRYAQPKISADGSRIFFIRSEGNDSGDLMMFETARNSTRVLVEDVAGINLGVSRIVSNNGSRLVYSAQAGDDDHELFVYDLNADGPRQITSFGSRVTDVPLAPAISGDGKRISFATRRRALNSSDGSVELYIFDVPTGQILQVTNAPSAATAEVVSSLSFDGRKVVFNFPRILSGAVSNNVFANNSEIYEAILEKRPTSGLITVINAASRGTEPASTTLAAGSIVSISGSALCFETRQAKGTTFALAGTTVRVGDRFAQLLDVSPNEVIAVLPAELPDGVIEMTVTNIEGFQSRSSISITDTAPGVFTSAGDGRGDAIVIDADRLLPAPFDPSDGRLRLSVFVTGCRNAHEVTASLSGHALTVESVVASPSLPGLDEIHLLIPEYLRGLGIGTLVIRADEQESNLTSLTLAGNSLRDIMINEFLADPPDGLAGDANHDGTRDASADEFIELVNITSRDVDISGYLIETRSATGPANVIRHRFAERTILSAGTALVVFGGGKPRPEDPVFGGSQVVISSTRALSLNNSAGTINLRDRLGSLITFVTYGSAAGLPANQNQSLTRAPDVSGGFMLHTDASGSASLVFSPGTKIDLSPFVSTPAVFRVTVTPPSVEILAGAELQLSAHAFDHENREVPDVIFQWQSNAPNIVQVDQSGVLKGLTQGVADVFAFARGIESNAARISVSAPTPLPTATPTPSPSPSPTPIPKPTPAPSPSPAPTPTPLPTPFEVPVVISEFRTRGPNGANDEFIEIFNNSDSQVVIGGWKIRASNSTGTVGTRVTITANTILPARSYFLLTNSSGYSGSTPGDQTFSSGITNDGGIAITLSDDTVIDQVGLSTGSAFREGAHLLPLPSNIDQSYERKQGASGTRQDTADNVNDFQLLAPSSPQNLNGTIPGPSPVPSASPTPSATPTPQASPSPSPTATPSPTPSQQAGVVISQIYGGGGNAGASFRNDFIELFNSGQASVSLAGWSVQYAGASASTWSTTQLPNVTIGPGQYLLIQESSGGTNGVALPTPDVTGSINLAATAGKVAVVNSTTQLSGACPNDSTIVDLVGYGSSASCFRGAPAPSPANATAVLRKDDGCSDSMNNSIDFFVSTPEPRNISTPSNACATVAVVNLFRRLSSEHCRWNWSISVGWVAF